MHKLYKFFLFKEGKVAIVRGPSGSGRTSLIKHFANYCWERRKFDFIKYFEFEGINYTVGFGSKINHYLSSIHSGVNKTRHKKILILIDDLDLLIKKNKFDIIK